MLGGGFFLQFDEAQKKACLKHMQMQTSNWDKLINWEFRIKKIPSYPNNWMILTNELRLVPVEVILWGVVGVQFMGVTVFSRCKKSSKSWHTPVTGLI